MLEGIVRFLNWAITCIPEGNELQEIQWLSWVHYFFMKIFGSFVCLQLTSNLRRLSRYKAYLFNEHLSTRSMQDVPNSKYANLSILSKPIYLYICHFFHEPGTKSVIPFHFVSSQVLRCPVTFCFFNKSSNS